MNVYRAGRVLRSASSLAAAPARPASSPVTAAAQSAAALAASASDVEPRARWFRDSETLQPLVEGAAADVRHLDVFQGDRQHSQLVAAAAAASAALGLKDASAADACPGGSSYPLEGGAELMQGAAAAGAATADVTETALMRFASTTAAEGGGAPHPQQQQQQLYGQPQPHDAHPNLQQQQGGRQMMGYIGTGSAADGGGQPGYFNLLDGWGQAAPLFSSSIGQLDPDNPLHDFAELCAPLNEDNSQYRTRARWVEIQI